MLYSVAFVEKDGKKYYKQHRSKYHLENESAVLESIPTDTAEKMKFYYYEDGTWVFDEVAYEKHMESLEKEHQAQEEDNTNITQEDMLTAMMELAQQVSDIEDALIDVAVVVGGE